LIASCCKVANPQDILIFSKSAKKRQTTGVGNIDDSEKLRPEELNQQTIEALVAENNLKMEILPVDDLDIALHDFVSKDDKMAFYACLQRNLEETRTKLNSEADKFKIEEEDIIVKVGECMQVFGAIYYCSYEVVG
jgi:double-strand break repair protein MRE11